MAEPSDHAVLSDSSHPAWQDESEVAVAAYRTLRAQPDEFADADLIHEEDILQEAASWTALDHHILPSPVTVDGVRVRATAFNELHRRYPFVAAGGAQDYHVQGIAVGADESGNYFLRASVGCEGPRPDGELEVLAMFIGTTGLVGAIRWNGHIHDNAELLINTTGHDPRLAEGFDSITQVHLRFAAEPRVHTPPA